jgi:hypothetical protein
MWRGRRRRSGCLNNRLGRTIAVSKKGTRPKVLLGRAGQSEPAAPLLRCSRVTASFSPIGWQCAQQKAAPFPLVAGNEAAKSWGIKSVPQQPTN